MRQHLREHQGLSGHGELAAHRPGRVQILTAEPKQPHDRLGEVMLSVGGNPPREKVEQKLKRAAAKLGADAVFVQYDTTHVFPVAYANWWGGPTEFTKRRTGTSSP